MARFDPPPAEGGSLLEALIRGLAELRALALQEPFQRSLGAPRWDVSRLRRSNFFRWFQFAETQQMFGGGQPEEAGAAAFIEWPKGAALLLALLDVREGLPRVTGARAGEGVWALRRALASIERIPGGAGGELEVALARDQERGPLGWLLRAGTGERRFWPAFPDRYGLGEGAALSRAQYLDVLQRSSPSDTPLESP